MVQVQGVAGKVGNPAFFNPDSVLLPAVGAGLGNLYPMHFLAAALPVQSQPDNGGPHRIGNVQQAGRRFHGGGQAGMAIGLVPISPVARPLDGDMGLHADIRTGEHPFRDIQYAAGRAGVHRRLNGGRIVGSAVPDGTEVADIGSHGQCHKKYLR